MDPLALLTNLHGDGQATLHRLRKHGCDSLAALLAVGLDDVLPILGWPPARAERFLREAEALSRRMGPGLLDPEEDTVGAAPQRGGKQEPRAAEVLDDLEDDDAFEAEPAPSCDQAPAHAPAHAKVEPVAAVEELAGERYEAPAEPELEPGPERREVGEPVLRASLREEVLERWRALDAAQPPSDLLVPHTPAHPLTAPGHALAEARLDGLDPVRLRALQRADVTTVEELAEADDLELHGRTGLPYTVLARLTFLARREQARLGGAPRTMPTSLGARGDARARRETRAHGSIESAGPFA